MGSNLIRYSIALPCYNEALNISKIFERFRKALGARKDIEVILVDNGSSDHSRDIMEQENEKLENSFVRIVSIDLNQGYGYGILSGLKIAKGEFLGWTHADLQTDPHDIVRAIDSLESRDEATTILLKGKRIKRNLLDAFFTGSMSLVSSIALRAKLKDVNAQPKIFHKSFFEKIECDAPYDFSLDLYLLYKANRQGLNIVELPVSFEKRLYGESKGGGTFKGKFKLIRRTWAYIFELRRKIA